MAKQLFRYSKAWCILLVLIIVPILIVHRNRPQFICKNWNYTSWSDFDIIEMPWNQSKRLPSNLFCVSESNNTTYKGQFKYLITPKNGCSLYHQDNKIGVVVAILSAYGSFTRREEYRQSIMKIKETKTVRYLYLFFLANQPNVKPEIDPILKESQIYDDIVQEDISNSYQNLTLKTLGLFRWIDEYCRIHSNIKYVWRITEDVYFDPEVFSAHVEINPVLKSHDLYWGYASHNHPVMTHTQYAVNPPQNFLDKRYPDHHCGAAILFTTQSAIKMHRMSRRTPLIFPDDIFMAILAQKLGIPVTPANDFILDSASRGFVISRNGNSRKIICDHLGGNQFVKAWNETYFLKIDYDYIKTAKCLPQVWQD